MKFSVSRDLLLRPLQLVTGVVERRQTLPVLSNLLVTVEGQTLTLTGTDLEVQLVARVELPEAAAENGEMTLPARKLMDIWRALPDSSKVDLVLDDQRAVLRLGASKFQLATLPASEFPGIDEGAGD